MISRSPRRLVTAAAAALLALAAAATTAAPARADAASGPTTASAPSDTRVLDVPGTLGAVSGEDPGTLQVPIPAGFTPVSLNATLTPEQKSTGAGVLTTGDRQLASTPTDATHTVTAALSAADVTDGQLPLALAYTLPATASTDCVSTASDLITLSAITITLAGQAQPLAAVGDFFSSTVSSVSVIIPDDPTSAERNAGLIAVDAIASKYQLPVQVSLTTLSDAAGRAAADPVFGRVVRIQAKNAYISTRLISTGAAAPELLISGHSDELAGAARGMASQYLRLANSTSVEGPFVTLDPKTTNRVSLADLGSSDIEMQGYGRSEASVGVRQSAFGGPVESLHVTLTGTHSAIDKTISASIQVFWNNQLAASTMLGTSTAFDVSFDLDKSVVAASNTLKVQLNSVPQGGKCATASSPVIPLELSINGAKSIIAATRGQGLPAGFQRFPQALSGTLAIAFGSQGSTSDLVASAGDLVIALQRDCTQQLDITTMSLNAFEHGSAPGLVVGGDPDDARTLSAPLRFSEFKSITQGTGSFAVGVAQPFAALEAFQQNDRDVLLLGAYSPNPPDSDAGTSTLERSIAAQAVGGQFGWDALYDDLLVSTDARRPGVVYASETIAPSAQKTDGYRANAWWIVIGLIAALVLVFGGSLSLRLRRRRVARIVDSQADVDRRRHDDDLGE